MASFRLIDQNQAISCNQQVLDLLNWECYSDCNKRTWYCSKHSRDGGYDFSYEFPLLALLQTDQIEKLFKFLHELLSPIALPSVDWLAPSQPLSMVKREAFNYVPHLPIYPASCDETDSYVCDWHTRHSYSGEPFLKFSSECDPYLTTIKRADDLQRALQSLLDRLFWEDQKGWELLRSTLDHRFRLGDARVSYMEKTSSKYGGIEIKCLKCNTLTLADFNTKWSPLEDRDCARAQIYSFINGCEYNRPLTFGRAHTFLQPSRPDAIYANDFNATNLPPYFCNRFDNRYQHSCNKFGTNE